MSVDVRERHVDHSVDVKGRERKGMMEPSFFNPVKDSGTTTV